jgi:hypothetical protein
LGPGGVGFNDRGAALGETLPRRGAASDSERPVTPFVEGFIDGATEVTRRSNDQDVHV